MDVIFHNEQSRDHPDQHPTCCCASLIRGKNEIQHAHVLVEACMTVVIGGALWLVLRDRETCNLRTRYVREFSEICACDHDGYVGTPSARMKTNTSQNVSSP